MSVVVVKPKIMVKVKGTINTRRNFLSFLPIYQNLLSMKYTPRQRDSPGVISLISQ